MGKIKLDNVRLSFPNLFKKATFSGEETKYEATFLLDKDKHATLIKQIKGEIDAAIKEKWDGKIKSVPADKLFMKDGDAFDYVGYAGNMSVKASCKARPMCVDRDRTPLTEDDNKLYAGCYVNGIIELWVQDNSYGKRVNANLLGVQFFKDGAPFADGVTASVSDFDAFESEVDDFV